MSLLPTGLPSSPSLSSWVRSPLMQGLQRDCTMPPINSSAISLEDWPWPRWQEPRPSRPSADLRRRRQRPLPASLSLRWIDMVMQETLHGDRCHGRDPRDSHPAERHPDRLRHDYGTIHRQTISGRNHSGADHRPLFYSHHLRLVQDQSIPGAEG